MTNSTNSVRQVKCLLTTAEAAEYLSVSEWTLRHWTCAGKIPFVRLGRLIRFRIEDLERLITEGLYDPSA